MVHKPDNLRLFTFYVCLVKTTFSNLHSKGDSTIEKQSPL